MPKLQEIITTIGIVYYGFEIRCLAKFFRHYSALSKNRHSKNFSKRLYTSMTKKTEEAQTKSRYQVIDHRRRQNVIKTSVTHFFVFISF